MGRGEVMALGVFSARKSAKRVLVARPLLDIGGIEKAAVGVHRLRRIKLVVAAKTRAEDQNILGSSILID